MPLRPCLGYDGHPCNRLTPNSRCSDCQAVATARREAARPTRRQRGYGAAHTRLAKAAVRAAVAAGTGCVDCGQLTDTDANGQTNPLSGDHVIPKSKGGQTVASNYEVRCRRCNSTKGSR